MNGPSGPTAAAMIDRFDLEPHPEGGHFRETWRGDPGPDGRTVGTAILFLLAAHEHSHWHRVDAAEIWLFHEGDLLDLAVAVEGEPERTVRLGPGSASRPAREVVPQSVVPAGAWQSARPAASDVGWSLVSCVVAPGFEFDGFELAAPEWRPESPDASGHDQAD